MAEYTRAVLERNINLVFRYGQKISIALGIFGAMLSLLLDSTNLEIIKNILFDSNVEVHTIHYIGVAFFTRSILAISVGMSFFMCALCARKFKYKTIEFMSWLESNGSINLLEKQYLNMASDDRIRDMVGQIYTHFLIAQKKHKYYNAGLLVSFIGCLILIFADILLNLI